MDKLNDELRNAYIRHYTEDITLSIERDFVRSIFTYESLSNCVPNSEYTYTENFEVNRKRKARIAKLINEKVALYELTEDNLNCADEIRTVLVNNTFFENMSNFCNLEIDEHVLSAAFDSFAKRQDMESILDQCYKDLFLLRALWYANCMHKALDQMPLPADAEERKKLLLRKVKLRDYINQKTAGIVQGVLNSIMPETVRYFENLKKTIDGEKKTLTAFTKEEVDKNTALLMRNGAEKDEYSSIRNFNEFEASVQYYYQKMTIAIKKMLEEEKLHSDNMQK